MDALKVENKIKVQMWAKCLHLLGDKMAIKLETNRQETVHRSPDGLLFTSRHISPPPSLPFYSLLAQL